MKVSATTTNEIDAQLELERAFEIAGEKPIDQDISIADLQAVNPEENLSAYCDKDAFIPEEPKKETTQKEEVAVSQKEETPTETQQTKLDKRAMLASAIQFGEPIDVATINEINQSKITENDPTYKSTDTKQDSASNATKSATQTAKESTRGTIASRSTIANTIKQKVFVATINNNSQSHAKSQVREPHPHVFEKHATFCFQGKGYAINYRLGTAFNISDQLYFQNPSIIEKKLSIKASELTFVEPEFVSQALRAKLEEARSIANATDESNLLKYLQTPSKLGTMLALHLQNIETRPINNVDEDGGQKRNGRLGKGKSADDASKRLLYGAYRCYKRQGSNLV